MMMIPIIIIAAIIISLESTINNWFLLLGIPIPVIMYFSLKASQRNERKYAQQFFESLIEQQNINDIEVKKRIEMHVGFVDWKNRLTKMIIAGVDQISTPILLFSIVAVIILPIIGSIMDSYEITGYVFLIFSTISYLISYIYNRKVREKGNQLAWTVQILSVIAISTMIIILAGRLL